VGMSAGKPVKRESQLHLRAALVTLLHYDVTLLHCDAPLRLRHCVAPLASCSHRK